MEGGTTADVSQAAVSSFLTAHPDECIGIVALQGDNGVGTLAAIQTAGRDEDCVLVVNNEDYFFSHVANYPEETCWYGCVTFQLKDYGQWIAPAMRQILDTGEMPEAVYVEHNVVTRDNIDELFPNWRAASDVYKRQPIGERIWKTGSIPINLLAETSNRERRTLFSPLSAKTRGTVQRGVKHG